MPDLPIEFIQLKETGRDGFHEHVTQMLRESHQPFFHDNTSFWNNAGFLDLWVPRTGVLDVVELKSESGRLSAEQKAWIAALEQCERLNVMTLRPSEYEAYRDSVWADWLARQAAGGDDPITRLADVIRAERAKRREQGKARRSGQLALGGRGQRRWRSGG